jgi:hypothetical protein
MHLIEFMDQRWLPASLRRTLTEILECGNEAPFRPYYAWAAGEVRCAAAMRGSDVIVELGAAAAPLTRRLARAPGHWKLVPCDIVPDMTAYGTLSRLHPGVVHPIYGSLDFARPHAWPPRSLLVFSGTAHHLPPPRRKEVLERLSSSSDVLILEPLRRSVWSMLFVLLSLLPAVALPVRFVGRDGRLRRFLWCWLMPVAPLLFVCDGVVSCLRQWTAADWRRQLGSRAEVSERIFSQSVLIPAGG